MMQNNMASNEEELGPFDSLSEDRAGEIATHITLHERGRVLLQLRETLRRRASYSLHTRRMSTALLAQEAHGDEDLATPSSATLAIAKHNGVDTDANTLMQSAVLALWTHVRVAMGFRRWKQAAKAPTDVSHFGSTVDLAMEARRILLAAESERLAVIRAAETAPTEDAAAKDDVIQDDADATTLVVSPRVVDSAHVRLTRDELDLLTVWARESHVKTFRSVDDASIAEVMRSLRLRTYQDGAPLFYEGETGDTFYIVCQGTVGVFVGMPARTRTTLSPRHGNNMETRIDWSDLGKRVFTYRSGDSFGETAMFASDAVRTASAVAVGPCEVCELHRDVYKRTLRKYHQAFFEQAQKLNFLQRIALFRDLPRQKLTALADMLEKKRLFYGETLVTIERSSQNAARRACFLVLSGAVKLTQSVEVPGLSHAPTSIDAAGGGRMRNKKRIGPHMKIELQTIVSNEIVGLETLLPDLPRSNGTTITTTGYTATAASAHVDVYVLHECDARSFIGGSHSALGQKILRLCETESAHRDRRRKQIQQTRLHTRQNAEDVDLTLRVGGGGVHHTDSIAVSDSIDLVAASPESPRSARTQHHLHHHHENVSMVPELQVAKQLPAISDGDAPYLPHLRATHLFPSAPNGLACSPRDAIVVSDVSVVSSPKMLSSCVRKFLFEHSDTLAHDYVERLSHQFPTPSPSSQPLLFAGASSFAGATKAQRDDQRVLEHQLSKMYDSKMHWDAKKRDFVLASSSSTSSHPAMSAGVSPSLRTGFLSSSPRCVSVSGVHEINGRDLFLATPPPMLTSRTRDATDSPRHAAARRRSTFHQELQATQHMARKIVEHHLKRVGGTPRATGRHTAQGSNNSASDATNANGTSFLHVFADS